MRSSILSASPATERIDIPRPPGVLRRFFARHPWVTDSLVASTYLFLHLLSVAFLATGGREAPSVVVYAILGLVITAAVLFRRHRPRLVFVVIAAASILVLLTASEVEVLGLMFALYAIAVYRSSRAAWAYFGISAATVIVISWVRELTGYDFTLEGEENAGLEFLGGWLSAGIQIVILLFIATLLGTAAGNRRRYLGALVGRAAQLERELEQQAQIAAASERARIAREMHDVIAHSVTVMVALADGAAAESTRNPERAKQAMLSTAEAGRSALTEMRRLLGVLHDDAADAVLAPQPGFDQLGALVESFRAAGLPVSLSVAGQPPQGEVVQLTVYRIVQEALTNALRYARRASAVDVVVSADSHAVRVSVTDDGEGGEAVASGGAGRGIHGLKKRVDVFDGTISAGPGAAGGWSLLATIPLEENE